MTQTPRGIRLNNPYNIRQSEQPWHGKIDPSHDAEFEQFDTPENGIRAGMKLLLNYQDRYGLRTIRGIISRFAPSSENDTASYIDFVSRKTQNDPDTFINLHDVTLLAELALAIIVRENGQCPYKWATLLDVADKLIPHKASEAMA